MNIKMYAFEDSVNFRFLFIEKSVKTYRVGNKSLVICNHDLTYNILLQSGLSHSEIKFQFHSLKLIFTFFQSLHKPAGKFLKSVR